jgi:hypothetical protein
MRRILAVSFATLLLAACGGNTTVKDVWVADGFAAKRPSKIVVIGIAPDDIKRQQFEDALAAKLKDGTASRTLIPISQLKDKATAQAFFKDKGFDGAIIVRVVSVERHNETMPEHGSGLMGSGASMWGHMDPTAYQRDQNFVLETNTVVLQTDLFRVDTGERLVSATSSTFTAQDMNKFAGELFDEVAKKLKKQGVQ